MKSLKNNNKKMNFTNMQKFLKIIMELINKV